MDDFFNNEEFTNKLETLRGKKMILKIMKEIKEKIPDVSIGVFLCILDKKIDPTTSCMSRSGGLYKYSVELWNKYIFDNYKCNFELLIGYENICF